MPFALFSSIAPEHVNIFQIGRDHAFNFSKLVSVNNIIAASKHSSCNC